MKRTLAALLLAMILMTGCSREHAVHSIPMDQLTLNLPETFTDLSQEDTQAAFMYWKSPIYIHGFRESKQELLQYYESISLETYVRMLAEAQEPELNAEITDSFWTYSYSAALDGTEYTFLCVFYETGESFWRLQAGCPTEQFADNRQIMWDYITSAN